MDDGTADGPTAGRATSQSFKVVLLGEGCVGKTSLVLRYTEDKFTDKHVSTLQVRLTRVIFTDVNTMVYTLSRFPR